MANPQNFGSLKFSLYEKAHQMQMYESYYKNDSWDAGRLVPFHNIELSPAANILNYGQGIFEGMKAYRSVKNRIVMFRPRENGERFAGSCLKLAMPELPVKNFMKGVYEIVKANQEYVPDSPDGSHSLYLRPVCIGTEPMLGVRASREYLFYIFASPVGPYFDKVGVVNLMVTDVHRAAAHGTGDAKAVCNYAVTMRPREEALAAGFDGVIFLDSVHNKYVEEAGAANFFALLDDDTLATPELGSILPGITRDSIIRIARELFGLTVVEKALPMAEVCQRAKECFLCGTGAIITSIRNIHWEGTTHSVNRNDFQLAHRLYEKLINIQLQREEDPFDWVLEILPEGK